MVGRGLGGSYANIISEHGGPEGGGRVRMPLPCQYKEIIRFIFKGRCHGRSMRVPTVKYAHSLGHVSGHFVAGIIFLCFGAFKQGRNILTLLGILGKIY